MPIVVATSGIVAQAFREMEMSPIAGFGEESEEAIAAEEQYPVALDMCLSRADWSFASKMISAAQVVATSPDPDLPFVFEKPAHLVKVQRVLPRCAAWRLDADRILADTAPLSLRYTFRPEDESKLGAYFRAAVACHLAGLLAPRWTTSRNRSEALLQRGEDWLQKAAQVDRGNASGQRYDGRDREPDWPGAAVS